MGLKVDEMLPKIDEILLKTDWMFGLSLRAYAAELYTPC